jgi:hypothetical protein
VRLQNEGLNDFKFVQSGIMDRDDLPNTAKLITLTLGTGGAPLVVKSDPQMIGDLKGGTSYLATFNTKIDRNALSGTYELPLLIHYTYLRSAEQYGTDAIQYTYWQKNETIRIPVRIKPELQFDIVSTEVQDVNAGTEGYVTIVLNNTGREDGKVAILKIQKNDNSPVVPTDSSVYIGDFPAGSSVSGKFKVSVTKDAEKKSYPLDVFVNYENHEGDQVNSDITTIGVPVGGKIDFAVVSEPATIAPGQKKVITASFRNTGDTTAYNVQARISAVSPFTSADDTAFLDTLAPGEMKDAQFEISADGSATKKEYGLDAEVRYRDALENTMISDPMKVRVTVAQGSSIFTNPFVIVAIVALALAGGYVYYTRMKKNK